jgi:glycosyltransferase involved in cell wall biosynthesis
MADHGREHPATISSGPVLAVAVDVTPLLGRRTGIGVAVDGFIRHLAGRDDLRLVGFGLTARGRRGLAGHLPTGVRATGCPVPAGAVLRLWPRLDFPPGEWWTGRVDVVHGTNFVVPPSRRAARVVTVWDMTPVRYPELSTATSRRYPALVRRAVATGAWVHTGAQSVAVEIVEHFGADPERVRVVAPGLDRRAGSPPADRSGPRYVLAMGRTEPRKDLPGLVQAFDLVADQVDDVELRIAGPAGWGEDALAAAIATARHRNRIQRLGWIDEPDALMKGATVFAYPSLYEGFGLPPLEAMAMGVPVVATSAGAVPDVVGEAAVLVGPGDPAELASALFSVVEDEGLRARLVAAGAQRVGRFTGEEAATGLARLYSDAAASRR